MFVPARVLHVTMAVRPSLPLPAALVYLGQVHTGHLRPLPSGGVLECAGWLKDGWSVGGEPVGRGKPAFVSSSKSLHLSPDPS